MPDEITRISAELLRVLGYSWVTVLEPHGVGSLMSRLKSELKSQSTCIVGGSILPGKIHPRTIRRQPMKDANHWGNFAPQANFVIVLSGLEKAMKVLDEARNHGARNKTWLIISERAVPYYSFKESHPGESVFVLSKQHRDMLPELKEFRHSLTRLDTKGSKNRTLKIESETREFLSDWSRFVDDYPCNSMPSSESLVSSVNHAADILSKVSHLRETLSKALGTKSIPLKSVVNINLEIVNRVRSKIKSFFTTEYHLRHSYGNAGLSSGLKCDKDGYILRKVYWNNTCNSWAFSQVGAWRNKSGWEVKSQELVMLKKRKKVWKCPSGKPVKLPAYWDHCLQTACLTCPTDNQSQAKTLKNNSCRLCTLEKCSDIPLAYVRFSHSFALTITSLCAIGEVFVILIIIIFVKYRKTPVVKSSNRMFNFLTLSTLGLWFVVIPGFLGRPNYLRCNTIVAAFLMLYATVSSILLSKTVRLLLIFKSMKQGAKWLGNASFFFTTVAFVLIQALLCAINFIFYPVEVESRFRTDSVLLHCGRRSSPVTALGFAYNCLLSGLCGFFAYKVRKLPQNFNEAKYISFAIFSYSVSWIIVFTGYYDENCSARQTAVVSLGLTTGACSVLACLFFPKVHTILFFPQLNTKSATIEGARRYSIEAAVSIGCMRSPRPRSSTLELPCISKTRTNLVLPKVTPDASRPRAVSDSSIFQLVADGMSRHSSACSTETGTSETPESVSTSLSGSAPTSPA